MAHSTPHTPNVKRHGVLTAANQNGPAATQLSKDRICFTAIARLASSCTAPPVQPPHRSLRRLSHGISSHCIDSRLLTQHRFSRRRFSLHWISLLWLSLHWLSLHCHWLSKPSFAALPRSLKVTIRGRVRGHGLTGLDRPHPCVHHEDITERLRSGLRAKKQGEFSQSAEELVNKRCSPVDAMKAREWVWGREIFVMVVVTGMVDK